VAAIRRTVRGTQCTAGAVLVGKCPSLCDNAETDRQQEWRSQESLVELADSIGAGANAMRFPGVRCGGQAPDQTVSGRTGRRILNCVEGGGPGWR